MCRDQPQAKGASREGKNAQNLVILLCLQVGILILQKIIVDTGLLKPEGLACDWVGEKLYWTDSETKRIEVTSLPGSQNFFRTVLVYEDLDLPRAISVAPTDGLMFWSDWGPEFPKIERADMDGKNRMILVDNNVAWPNALTLDYDKKLLYWIDAKLKYIASVDWDGHKMNVVYDQPDSLPLPFAMSAYKSELYWTDWKTKYDYFCSSQVNKVLQFNHFFPFSAIHFFNMTGDTFRSPGKLRLRGKLTVMDIKVFEPSRQIAIPGFACARNNGYCSHLCLASNTDSRGYTCACPTGIKLVDEYNCAEEFTEVLLLARRTDIRKISLDTPDFSDILIPVTSTEDNEEFR